MIKTAIAGNIASGKSTVEQILKDFGYKVLDTDEVCHSLLNSDNAVFEAIENVFPQACINGSISRVKLGEIVFANAEKRQVLESILHPAIKTKIEEFFSANQQEKVVFVSVPLLFEANMEGMFDKIIFVSCDAQTRIGRLMKRNNLTVEEALNRINSQNDEKGKIKKSDFVIVNDKTLDCLRKEVLDFLKGHNFL